MVKYALLCCALLSYSFVRRWHAVKAKFLVEHTGIEFKATPECTGVLKFDGLFQMVIKVILDKGRRLLFSLSVSSSHK